MLAGRYLNAAQELADALILSPLVHRQLNRNTYKPTYSNIQALAKQARSDLQSSMKEGLIKQQPITPRMLYERADNIIEHVKTLDDEMIGLW